MTTILTRRPWLAVIASPALLSSRDTNGGHF
jgi:hypothetical protein